jgi:hypothetical protein
MMQTNKLIFFITLCAFFVCSPQIDAPALSEDKIKEGDCVFQEFKPDNLFAEAMGVRAEIYGEVVEVKGKLADVFWNCQNAYASEETKLGNQFLGKVTSVPLKFLISCSSKGYTSFADLVKGGCRK